MINEHALSTAKSHNYSLHPYSRLRRTRGPLAQAGLLGPETHQGPPRPGRVAGSRDAPGAPSPGQSCWVHMVSSSRVPPQGHLCVYVHTHMHTRTRPQEPATGPAWPGV